MSDDSGDRNDGDNDRHGDDLKDSNDNDDDKVGYRKPPKHSRFKKGQSGNYKGRPKKSRDFEKLLQAKLDQKIKVKMGDRTQMLTNMDALIDIIISGAHHRDRTCMKLLIDLLIKRQTPEPLGTSPEELDDLQRLLKNLPSEPEKLTFEEDESEEERKNDDACDDGGPREASHE